VFRDKDRTVDFILVWEDNSEDACKKRKIFENGLRKEGLIMEEEPEKEGLILEREQNQLLHFVKIHAPNEVLGRYAEILKLRMPTRVI
jgi:hypothetical protein